VIPIYITLDNNYKDHWRHVYNSIKANTRSDISFNIICEPDVGIDASEDDINIICVEPLIEEYRRFNKNNTRAVYLRWMIPSLCKADKAIYLDCDLVVTGDIKELYDTDLGDNYIGAVRTYGERVDLIGKIQGMDLDGYDNILSGQLLINCGLWREDCITEMLVEFATENDVLDEAPLTVVCDGRIKYLDRYWCVPASHVEDMQKNPGIKYIYDFSKAKLFHFSGAKKPMFEDGLRNKELYEVYK
jgi:lipopolysaccharide biosynthesis glycosyltransferase